MAIIKHDQALKRFRSYLETEGGYSEACIAGYVSCARLFFAWLGQQKKNWSAVGIEEAGFYFTRIRRRYAPTTSNFHLRSLKLLYKWGEQHRYVQSNPWYHLRRVPGDPKKRKPLSLDEIERIREFDPGDDWFVRRDHALVLFLLSTGMRVAACQRVNLSDIDLADGRVSVLEKGGRRFWKAILPPAIPFLTIWIEELRPLRAAPNEPALWIGRWGNRVDAHTIRCAVQRIRMACGIETPATPQDLRRSIAKLMRRAQVPKEDIQKYMGHKRLQTTEIYCDEDDERGLEVARRYHPLLVGHTSERQP